MKWTVIYTSMLLVNLWTIASTVWRVLDLPAAVGLDVFEAFSSGLGIAIGVAGLASIADATERRDVTHGT